jgi:diadenosine tetraphosphate (Ap4A) HIT family hydrolase
MTMANATESKFGDPATRIAQTERWSVLARPKQPTLGSLVLVCREPVRAFSDLSAEAFVELGTVVLSVERTLRDFVAYERINYLMLMMVDPDVHFHVIPRYPDTRTLLGLEYRDAGWPGPPALDRGVDLDDKARDALVAALRQGWARSGA